MSKTAVTQYGTLPLDLEDVPVDSRLYLGLSGGLDSTYTAWRLLEAGYPLLLHLCEFHSESGRHRFETAAQEQVLTWFIERGGLTRFTVHRTSVNLGPLGTLHNIEWYSWITGMILRANPDVYYVVSAACKEDAYQTPADMLERLDYVMAVTIDREATILVPKHEYSKAEFIRDMPPDLIARCWWCRQPKGKEPCHECFTCKLADEAFETLGIEPTRV